MKKLLIGLVLLSSMSSFAGSNVEPSNIKNIEFTDCGYTDAGQDDDLAKFTMSEEQEDETRVLTSMETGEIFATCSKVKKGIKCRIGAFSSFVLDYSKLKAGTRESGSKYFSIKSVDHYYQCNQF
jgi:hypothetical protein